MKAPPRFIAGAVCSACGAVDRVLLERGPTFQQRRCVTCGHSDRLAEGPQPLPPSRFDAPRTEVRTESAATVRILGLPPAEGSAGDRE